MKRGSAFRRLFRLPESEARAASDVADEIAFHLDARMDALVSSGMNATDARAQAMREFGDAAEAQAQLSELLQRRIRLYRRATLRDAFRQDFRSAWRSLRHDPAFTIGVIATLALAIGVNASMFGLADRLLFRGPPQVQDARHVMRIYFQQQFGSDLGAIVGVSYPEYEALRNGAPAFSGIAAYTTASAPIGRGGSAERAAMLVATSTYFDVLGVHPEVGRFFNAAEDAPGASQNVVVLSHRYWEKHYGSSYDALGREVEIARRKYEIIGVAPRGFRGIDLDAFDLIVPASAYASASLPPDWNTTPRTSWLSVIGRVPDDNAVAAAEAQATAVRRMKDPGYGKKQTDHALLVPAQPGHTPDVMRGSAERMQTASVLLLVVSLLVVLIATANIANLIIARTLRRDRELAVRVALGVPPGRLYSLLGFESVVVCASAGVCGLALAQWGFAVARGLLVPDADIATSFVVDAHMSLYVAAILLCCALAMTIAPVVKVRRMDIQNAIRSGARAAGGRHGAGRSALVVLQATLSVVLLTGAALFIRSFERVQHVDLGFSPSHLMVMTWDMRGTGRTEADFVSFYDAAVSRVASMPGVQSAAVATSIPFLSSTSVAMRVPGRDSLPAFTDGGPYLTAADTGYFRTMGIRILRGRSFTSSDVLGAPQVAVVDETFASAVWPGSDALGKSLCMDDQCRTVIGVTRNANRLSVTTEPAPQVFIPITQSNDVSRALFVRLATDDAATRRQLRSVIQSSGPDLPFARMLDFEDVISPMTRSARAYAAMFSAFGILAVAVALVGLYSVVSHAVQSRRQEMGVRLALGAHATQVVALIVQDAARLIAIGLVTGIALASWLSRYAESLLFKLSARDTVTYFAVAALVGIAGVTAALIPALRGRSVSPTEALQAE